MFVRRLIHIVDSIDKFYTRHEMSILMLNMSIIAAMMLPHIFKL